MVILTRPSGCSRSKGWRRRVTNSGKIFSKVMPDKGILIELTCETDFVARNDLFLNLGKTIVEKVAAKNLAEPTDELQLLVKEAVGTIKENMQLRRIVTLPIAAGDALVEYIHDDRIGVMLRFTFADAKMKDNPRVKEILFECALHAAAFAPLFLSKDKVSPAFLKDQEEIFAKQAENLGKPQNVLQGIIKGKVAKMLAETCLLEQPFVKDDKRKVAKVLEDLSKEVGTKVELVDYKYIKLGGE
jgi:elongation factor Ts